MKESIPTHVAIIMDGNRRWAKKRMLPSVVGHKMGADNLKQLVEHVFKSGVKVLSVFAFSTENFKRSKDEVDSLMNLFINYFSKFLEDSKKNGIRIVFSGRKEGLPDNLWNEMKKIEKETKDFDNKIFNICLNYGANYELYDAIKKVLIDEINIDDLSPDNLNDLFYQNLPDIDLLIRTSGEIRVSNFMIFQARYAEFYFTDVLFPDFNEKEFDKAILEYSKRTRKYGGSK